MLVDDEVGELLRLDFGEIGEILLVLHRFGKLFEHFFGFFGTEGAIEQFSCVFQTAARDELTRLKNRVKLFENRCGDRLFDGSIRGDMLGYLRNRFDIHVGEDLCRYVLA